MMISGSDVSTPITIAATHGSPFGRVRDSAPENGSIPALAMPKMCRHMAVNSVLIAMKRVQAMTTRKILATAPFRELLMMSCTGVALLSPRQVRDGQQEEEQEDRSGEN